MLDGNRSQSIAVEAGKKQLFMWKVLKFFGWLLKLALGLLLFLFLAGIVCLYFAGRGLPDVVVQKIADRLSSDPRIQDATAEHSSIGPLIFRIDRITYSIGRGLTVHRIKALPKRVTESPFVSAEEINVVFTLLSLAPFTERIKHVTIKGFDFPALPPRPPRDPDTPRPPPVPREINVTLPDVSPFELVLERSNILGLQTERVTATIAATPEQATATDLRVKWPERFGDVGVKGDMTFDVATKRIIAHAQGRAFPHLITPFLLGLRAKGVVTQMDFFQDFKAPITVDYAVDLELTKIDYAMHIDLHVPECTYHGVPFKQAQGTVVVTDTNNLTIADITLPECELRSGAMAGHLVYRDDNDSLTVDVQGTLAKDDLVAILNIFKNNELDLLQCETPVNVRAKGIAATNLRKAGVTNDLNATLSFAKGSILRVPLTDASCDLRVYAHSACVDNIKATPADGGKLEGQVHFAFPNYEASNTTFVAQISADRASFSNLMCIGQPTNTFTGKVTGKVSLAGSASGNVMPTLEGSGSAKVEESVLAQMPLFAGLTAWFARNIPGISSVVNQSSAKLDFTMTNGIAVTKNMVVEGNVFSILLRGTYALDTDALDMAVRVNILKEQTIMGDIMRILTAPITHTLLEFKISGTAANPEWAYVTFVEKLIDTIF
ncbi:MAG: AsmA-like C-terminal region-containing protein [Kiritimatiellaeota bacterium]|nr:AsmA-like C-terminal region-containing protein [Kiritimatiellota bacterium]